MALYFSRSVIPHIRGADPDMQPVIYKRHIGMYAYRASTLRLYKSLEHCDLEKIEKLEQLRLLWNGLKIHVAEATRLPGPGVDTAEDLEKVKQLLASSETNT